ncbi:MAG TPA: calcium/sodium antiporter [Aggregatilineales bacterium]|nr:calcium/sodium antiporter [Anaerolineales bacterium]HRE49694.1 calcium/sodium antiporter [Aggregatilineales bacterium]
MLGALVLLVAGLAGLYVGSVALVRGASRLALSFGIPSLIIGLTVVAWATSAPELVVNLSAAVQGVNVIALGNIIGSNVVNIGLVLGVMALLTRVRLSWELVRREIPFMIAATALFFLLSLDGSLSRMDGMILFGGFIFYIAFVYVNAQQERRKIISSIENIAREEAPPPAQINRLMEARRVVFGVTLLVIAANLTVDNASLIAREVGISEFIIGLSVVAIGTSLPEIAASLVAARRGETDIAVGNVIGSNIMNILAILGVTAIIQPMTVSPALLQFDLPFLLIFSATVLLVALNRVILRREALLLIGVYIVFIAWSFLK